jgi:hypothetical protein
MDGINGRIHVITAATTGNLNIDGQPSVELLEVPGGIQGQTGVRIDRVQRNRSNP